MRPRVYQPGGFLIPFLFPANVSRQSVLIRSNENKPSVKEGLFLNFSLHKSRYCRQRQLKGRFNPSGHIYILPSVTADLALLFYFKGATQVCLSAPATYTDFVTFIIASIFFINADFTGSTRIYIHPAPICFSGSALAASCQLPIYYSPIRDFRIIGSPAIGIFIRRAWATYVFVCQFGSAVGTVAIAS